jgi:hypothetical protein
VSDLRVELLYTPGCPHWEAVHVLLRRILAEGAIETPIQLVVVSSPEDAEFLGFAGSPSVRLNGVDVVEPAAGTTPGLGCRLYRGPDGRTSGRIPEEVLRAAVQAQRRGRLEAFQRQEAARVAAAAIEADGDEQSVQRSGDHGAAPGRPDQTEA